MESIESRTPPLPSIKLPESTKSQLLFMADSARSPNEAAIPVEQARIMARRNRGVHSIHGEKIPGNKNTAPTATITDPSNPPIKPAMLLLGLTEIIPRFFAPNNVPNSQARESLPNVINKNKRMAPGFPHPLININQNMKSPGYIRREKQPITLLVMDSISEEREKILDINAHPAPAINITGIIHEGKPKLIFKVADNGAREPRIRLSAFDTLTCFFSSIAENSSAPTAEKKIVTRFMARLL